MWIFDAGKDNFINTSTGHKICVVAVTWAYLGGKLQGVYEVRYTPAFSKDQREYMTLAENINTIEEANNEFEKICDAIKAGQDYFDAGETRQPDDAPEDFYPEFDELVISGYVDHFTRDQFKLNIYCKRRQFDSDTFAISVPATADEYFEKADLVEGDYLKVRATNAIWVGDAIRYNVFSSDDILKHERTTILKG